ncbi:odorant receptor 131-2-like [Periophthalmus magnuspinnatus]|uniref:odorant receptor 131-2-like n=1 Tax=Periophthalmus magnuspinnatus TaxID=409849 RepID=UPI00145B1DC9|nr:odorant receptor 131-2-like [Periophthalmus magnuspinnatus]
MNISGGNSTPVLVRDSLQTAILKNVITVVLCLSINYINATLVYTFIRHEIFKINSRYILYIHLVMNDIILLTILTLIQVLSYIVYTLNVSLCILLVLFGMAANFNNPMTLAVMALECYIAVCYPLQHSQICTVKNTYIVIAFIWLISGFYLLPDKDKIFDAVLMAIVWLTLFYTYLRILFTAKAAAADARKARNTVLLHSFQLMLSMLTYLYYIIFFGLLSLFPDSARDIRFAITIFISIMPRLVSPLVYGLRDKSFRKYLKQHMFCTKAVV